MRIVYCGCFRLPNFDAAAPRVLNNAKIFLKLGHEVTFFSWGGKYREEDLCVDGHYRIDGAEYIITNELDAIGGFFDKVKMKIDRGRKSLMLLTQMKSKPDLVIMYNADYWFTRRMLKFCNKHRIKLVNDITEWYDNNELHLTDLIPNYLNMNFTQRYVKNKIVISSFLDNYYSESHNIILPPLCDPNEKKWSIRVHDERVNPFNGVTLIYAGNPAKKDCIHTVINAVNTLAKDGNAIRFLILGVTFEAYMSQYSQLLMCSSLHKNVMFLGRVSQDLIPAYYKMADFMVLLREPNRKNTAGFPTKFAESMTAGVPVIANATSDLTEYLINGVTGFLIDGFDYDSVVNTLRETVINISRENIDRMKENVCAINYAFDLHSKINEMKKYINSIG